MTKEEINREVAKVMGWHKWSNAPALVVWFQENNEPSGFTSEVGANDYFDPYHRIEHAWMVVEKVQDCLHLKQHGKDGRWEAMFCGISAQFVSADTAPAAICLAALEAVKEE